MTRAERKRLLRAEARAWRQLAESLAAESPRAWLGVRFRTFDIVWSSMERRTAEHRWAIENSTPPHEWRDGTRSENVLAALFLALECDDEAAAL